MKWLSDTDGSVHFSDAHSGQHRKVVDVTVGALYVNDCFKFHNINLPCLLVLRTSMICIYIIYKAEHVLN